MSRKSKRANIFNEYTLRYLQILNWYRVNMNICGCSLRGECSFGVFPYEIHINQKNLRLYCYKNKVFKEQCSIDNNIYFFNLKKYNDNNIDFKQDYLTIDQCKNYDIPYEYNTNLLYKDLFLDNIDDKFNEQNLILISPVIDNYCKCHLKTILFYNENEKEYNNYINNYYKIENLTINDLNKIVYASFTVFNMQHSISFREILDQNNVFLLKYEYSPNFLFSILTNDHSSELLSSLPKYTLFRGSQTLAKLGNKKVAYTLYSRLRNRFPKNFDYMTESYMMPRDKDIIKNKFGNYSQKEEDLWLCKRANGSLGEGIYFLKNYEDFLNCSEIISKYIHNPHLYKKRKYHIRLYNFISSIRPLIIYLYKEGQIMRASHEYKYNLTDISDKRSFLTNGHINFGKEGYLEDLSVEELKGQIIKEGGDWDYIWRQIRDISIKVIISIYDMEYSKLNEFTNYLAKSFVYFGLDLMIDENYKVWFLEANDCAHMEPYDKVNEKNKMGITTDILNILGMVPFDHSNNIPIEDKKCVFKSKIEEKINDIFCEFNRPKGNLEKVFPVKETLSYYKKFFLKEYPENLELWKYIEI